MKPFFLINKTVKFVSTLLVLLAGASLATAQSFVLSTDYPVDNGPNNAVAADINNDGKLDLISANQGNLGVIRTNNTLTVFTNNGTGVFGSNATYTVGQSPFVTAADVRGSGRRDLIVASFLESSVLVLTNNGAGMFGSNATYNAAVGAGNGPYNIVAADVNGDGKPDWITANNGTNYDGNTLTVFTNNGNGRFTFSATLLTGNLPTVTAADLRGTGRPDLISANYSDNAITVLTNNGSGVFGSNVTYHVGSSPINVAAADLNGDAKLDLICANSGDNTVTVLTNNGNGTFTPAATNIVGNVPYVAAADVNGDGKADVITANYNDATLTVLTNNGAGVLASNVTYDVRNSPVYVLAADLNNDGRQELISANYGDDSLTVRLETPKVAMQFSNHTATISWPPLWAGYVLQTNANLGILNWGNAVNPTGTNRLTFPAASGNNLFRLRHP